MLGFWETKIRNKMVFMYSFAPFLEEAGTLLLGSEHLWHTWSTKRRDELAKISYELKDRARTLRQRGLVWASNVSEFGENLAYLLSTATHHRYHNNDVGPNCPEAAPYTTRLAADVLFHLIPIFQKIEEASHYKEKGWVEWLSEIIETLVEAPYYDSRIEIPENILRIVAVRGILIECEGLAYTQAIIEDSFNRENPGRKRKESANLSDAELQKLAFEIGMPFEVVKEVFETEFSSWWKQAEEYRNQAEGKTKLLLSTLTAANEIKENIGSVWDPGMTTQNGSPKCYSEQQLQKSERIISTFISMFLFSITKDEQGDSVAITGVNRQEGC